MDVYDGNIEWCYMVKWLKKKIKEENNQIIEKVGRGSGGKKVDLIVWSIFWPITLYHSIF